MIFVPMDFALFPLLFTALGLAYIGLGLWSYYGRVEADGAPRGLGGLHRTWHGRGTACSFIPAGVFFLCLSLSGMVVDDTLQRILSYLALVALGISVLFFIRPPLQVWPAWLRTRTLESRVKTSPAPEITAPADPPPGDSEGPV